MASVGKTGFLSVEKKEKTLNIQEIGAVVSSQPSQSCKRGECFLPVRVNSVTRAVLPTTWPVSQGLALEKDEPNTRQEDIFTGPMRHLNQWPLQAIPRLGH